MDTERRTKKKKTQRKVEKNGSFERRSPLQNLNGHPIHKPFVAKKSSNLSSSSSAVVSVGAPKCRSKLPLYSITCSGSSSSGTHLVEKPKTFSRLRNDLPKRSSETMHRRSKENEVPRRPFMQKSRDVAKPKCEIGQRSKLSSGQRNPVSKLKKGSQGFQQKMKNSLQENVSGEPPFNRSNSNSFVSYTPVGKLGSESGLASAKAGDHETIHGNNATPVKTPPVEASVSPEIQGGSHSKMLLAKSAATPICYGAGHLLSGVTDKRKCRRRGSLRGGCEKSNLFTDEKSIEDPSNACKDATVPLPAEASVRWLLSPCDEECEDRGSDSGKRLDQCRTISVDNSLGDLGLLSSSPSVLCGYESDSLYQISSYNGSGSSVGNAISKTRSRITTLSPSKASDRFQGILEPLNNRTNMSLLAASPNSSSMCTCIGSKDRKKLRNCSDADVSAFSVGPLSSGNIIQTPDSELSSHMCLRKTEVEVFQRDHVPFGLGSISESPNRVGLSEETLLWDGHFAETGSSQVEKHVDSISSWVSDSTSENLALSRMRISWRDGLVSKIVETDEADCCCCLSDEEYIGPNEQLMGSNNVKGTYPGAKSGEIEENDIGRDIDLSPVLLDYEPCISVRGKEKMHSRVPDTCAESICTNGGGLVASGDSDWTYSNENHLYQEN